MTSSPGTPGDPKNFRVSGIETSAINNAVSKVLVVDDEIDLAEMCSMLLRAHGLDVVTANSAKEALHWLEQDPEIDAVLSDIIMPGMDGLELGDAINERYPHVKVVLVSGYTTPGAFEGRKRPSLFAVKPYRIERILELLQS